MCTSEQKGEPSQMRNLKTQLEESKANARKLSTQNRDLLKENEQLGAQNKVISEQIETLEHKFNEQDQRFKRQLDSWYKELDQYKEEIEHSTKIVEEKQLQTESDIAKIIKFRESQSRATTLQAHTTKHQLPGPNSDSSPTTRTQPETSSFRCAKEKCNRPFGSMSTKCQTELSAINVIKSLTKIAPIKSTCKNTTKQ